MLFFGHGPLRFSTKGEALSAFAKGMMVLQPKIEPESTLVMARVNEYVNIRLDADQDSEKVGVLYKDCGGDPRLALVADSHPVAFLSDRFHRVRGGRRAL